jgi:hypothetical protein
MNNWEDTDRRWEKESTPAEQLEFFNAKYSPEITAQEITPKLTSAALSSGHGALVPASFRRE